MSHATPRPEAISTIAGWLRESKSSVTFTGAGISTESGIPDFRSPGGVWASSQPVYFDEFLRSKEARIEYWRQKSLTHHEFVKAEPNVTHRTLATWERRGLLRGVVTQNIDGLHHEAGSQEVLELHGTARQVGCLSCEARFDAGPYVWQFEQTNEPPACPECAGMLKHATISFGQSLDQAVLHAAAEWCVGADLVFALGSSLVVEPAASLPRLAKEEGARLVIINRDPTPLDSIADVCLAGTLGETLSAINAALDA